jgi:hypothetical protein
MMIVPPMETFGGILPIHSGSVGIERDFLAGRSDAKSPNTV